MVSILFYNLHKNRGSKMVSIIKPIRGTAGEVSLATANTVSNANLIRVINTGTGTALLNLANTTGGIYANVTLLANSVTFIVKDPTDTANGVVSTVRAAAIAYRD